MTRGRKFDHAGLKALAKELGRPLYTLEVLRSDPLTAGIPWRKAGAKWAAAVAATRYQARCRSPPRSLRPRFAIQAGAHAQRCAL